MLCQTRNLLASYPRVGFRSFKQSWANECDDPWSGCGHPGKARHKIVLIPEKQPSGRIAIRQISLLMKKVFIPILIGIGLTVVFVLLGGLAGGACHCLTPTTIFFPYGTSVLQHTSRESAGFLLIALQFPVYSIILANVSRGRRRILTLLILFAVHGAAALVGLIVYQQ